MIRPWWFVLGTIVLMTGFALGVLATHDWDPMAFVLDRPKDAPPDKTWGIGYDGQQAYAIALDPINASAKLDRPSYRYMRIIYPLLAHILAVGRHNLIPWSLLIVNIVAAAVTAGLLADRVLTRGGRSWVALAVVFSFNYLAGVRMDLNEPLAYCLALTGLWIYERGNLAMAVVSFALAGLTKEVALAFPLALVAWEALKRRWPAALTILIGSLAPYFIWAGIVTAWQGISPFSYQLARPILIPFAGFVHLEGFESRVMVLMWSVGPAIIAGIAALWQILKTPLSTSGKDALLVLANVGVVATLPAMTWVDPLAVLRLGVGSMIAIVLWLATVRPRVLYYAAGLWSPSLLMTIILPGFLL